MTITTRADVTIKLNGSTVSPAFMRSLLEVIVDTNLHLPAMFTIRLHDNEAAWADNESIAIGKPVEIAITAPDQGNRSGVTGTLIKGEITAIEPEFSTFGAILTFSGYCKSHRLHRGTFTRAFLNRADSDVVSSIAGETGLSATVQSTSIRHEYVIQYNQSNWEFLSERAARLGYRLYVEDSALHFSSATTTPTSAPDLTWGETLRTFRPRLTAAAQNLSISARAWDPKTKKEAIATSTEKALIPTSGFGEGGITVANTFGSGTRTRVNIPSGSVDYLQAIANATANQASGRNIQAEGEAIGDPRILAGKSVKISGVGTRFGGTYTVTSATHHYSSEGTYLTRFAITGTDPDTLYALLPGDAAAGREYGVVAALVTNTNDPENKGRIKVKFPWLSDTIESAWARVATPMAGASRGLLLMPEVNDEVLIAFEHGDLTRPYMLGALWNGKDVPPTGAVGSGGAIEQRLFKSVAGHQIIFVEKAGSEAIKIIDKTGKNTITIDSVKNDITISAEGNMTFDAKGKITIAAQMDVAIQSKTGKLTLNGTTGAELVSNATCNVKGSVVQVQGSGPVTVKGNPIALN